jgi:Holliday junction resolvase RusA-like endonuclease
MRKQYRLDITPQTHVRATVGDRILFKIGKANLRPAGLKRLLRLERYNEYKVSLSAEAKRVRLTIPEQGIHLLFYIPVPPSWRKWQKEKFHMRLHSSTPDWDNLAKAFFDSIMTEDKQVADVRVTKYWVNQDRGWIDVVLNLPEHNSLDTLM